MNNLFKFGAVLICLAAASGAKIEKPWWLWQDVSLDAGMSRIRATPFDDEPEPPPMGFRLLNETVPYHYTLWFSTDIHEGVFPFQGNTRIYVNVNNQTDRILLHTFLINIESIKVQAVVDDWPEVPVSNYTSHPMFELLEINLEYELSEDLDYVIDITYTANLQSWYEGLFGSYYINDDGEQKWFAATQFKPIDARLAFPCYDEPRFRTTFDIIVNHDASLHAQSNMPGTEEILENGRIETTFVRTPAMSTHLIALLISEFDSQTLQSSTGVVHSMFTQPDLAQLGDFALNNGHALLNSMSDFFGMDYPLETYKQVAIPRYFLMAMGNWGLSIYNNELVLIDEQYSIRDIEIAAIVLAHEITHQWFGSVITPEWWSFLWLNEGFATFFEFYALDGVFPEMRMHEFFSVLVLQFTMRLDVGNVQPMNQYVQGFQQIMGQFNFVTFTKAACVIRQFFHAFGEDVFMRAMTTFLSHPDGVVNPDDLYNALESQVQPLNILPEGVTVKDVFDSWASQPSFPIVSVYRNRDTGEVFLTQDPWSEAMQGPPGPDQPGPDFSPEGPPEGPPENPDEPEFPDLPFPPYPEFPRAPLTWWIPLNAASRNAPSFESTTVDVWIPQNVRMMQYIPATPIGAGDWIIFNKQQTGYYRVNYDSYGWRLISEALEEDYDIIPPASRAQLLEDSFLLAEDGILDFGIAMNVMNYLPQEMDIAPWLIITRNLRFLDNLVQGQAFYTGFQEFFRRSTEPVLNYLGHKVVEGEAFLVTQQRQVVMEWNCAMFGNECLVEAAEQLKADIAGEEPIHPEMRPIIECYGVRGGGEEEFNHFIAIGNENALRAAACSGDGQILSAFVQQVFADTSNLDYFGRVRFIEELVRKGYQGHNIVLDYCLNNLDAVLASNIANYRLWDMLADELSTERQLSKLIELFVRISHVFNQNYLIQGIDRAERSLRWINLHGPALSKWVDDRIFSIPPPEDLE